MITNNEQSYLIVGFSIVVNNGCKPQPIDLSFHHQRSEQKGDAHFIAN